MRDTPAQYVLSFCIVLLDLVEFELLLRHDFDL